MSTILLYHGFEIIGTYYFRTTYIGGSIVFGIRKEDTSLRCPVCWSRHVIKRGSVVRKFRTLLIGKSLGWVQMAIPRVMLF